ACSSGAEPVTGTDAHEVAKTLEYTQLSDSNIRTFWSRLQDYNMALAIGDMTKADAHYKALSQSAIRYRVALDDAQFDPDSAYRRGIANAMLGFTGDPAVVPGLLAVATNPEERDDVRSRAVYGLFVMGARVNESEQRSSVSSALKTMMLPSEPSAAIRLNAVNAYGAMYNRGMGDSTEPLRSVLNDDPSDDVRRQAIVVLGDVAETSTVVDIVEIGLKDEEPRIRAASAQALGKIRSPLSLEALRRTISEDDSGVVRAEAVYAVSGQTGVADDAIVVNLILNGIRDIDDGVREASARAASRIGTQDAIVPLLPLTQDVSTNVRVSAITALGEITPKERESDIMPVVNSLNDGDVYVVRAAQRTLQKVTGENLGVSSRSWTTYYEDKYPKLTGKEYDGPLPPVGDSNTNRNGATNRNFNRTPRTTNRTTRNNSR
ncbi:MAG: HEAT repeat domain-containing protein, partial [Planctomycetales bacterium]|nr:HEAT repeat domain-containing protein [Planctomycetales bacterium]